MAEDTYSQMLPCLLREWLAFAHPLQADSTLPPVLPRLRHSCRGVCFRTCDGPSWHECGLPLISNDHRALRGAEPLDQAPNFDSYLKDLLQGIEAVILPSLHCFG